MIYILLNNTYYYIDHVIVLGESSSSLRRRDTWPDKLRRDLLKYYDKHSRPVISNNLTNVTVNTVLKYIDLVSFPSTLVVLSSTSTWSWIALHNNNCVYQYFMVTRIIYSISCHRIWICIHDLWLLCI